MYTRDNDYFLAMPRTGSRACCHSLRQVGFRPSGHQHWNAPEFPEGARIIAVMRNPFDWLVSAWYWGDNNQIWGTFDAFVKGFPKVNSVGDYYNTPGPHIRDGDIFWNVRKANVIIPYENLAWHWTQLFPDARLEVVGASNREPWQSYYSPKLIEWVVENYQPSFYPLCYDQTGFQVGRRE